MATASDQPGAATKWHLGIWDLGRYSAGWRQQVHFVFDRANGLPGDKPIPKPNANVDGKMLK
ncbi:GM10076 [Drosophila sechellia]|uniref:GM10076 n=1 Tax=Drosophila sechellia TaxID=7238 RepID=B4IPK2_DROSE|nr:GM10076 [Drosophila sechellia]